MESAVWNPILEGLSHEMELDSLDWRGVGDVQEFTRRVVTYMKDQKPESLIILGWSLGSLVALDIACQFPNVVSGLILLGGTSQFTAMEGEHGAGWHPRVVERMKRQLARDPDKTLKTFYTSMFSQEELERGEERRFLTETQAYFEGDSLESLTLGLDYLLHTDCRDALLEQPPMLLIHGEEDGICPLMAVQSLSQQTKGAVLRTIPGAGHIPFYTQPRICLDWMTSFLRGEPLDQ